jgi:hypothetical protein
MSVWGTSDPTGLTGDTDPTGGIGGSGNTLQLPQQQPQFSPFSPSSGSGDPFGGGLGDILGSMSPGAFDPNSLAVASGGGSSSDILTLLSSLLGGGGGTAGAGGTPNVGMLAGILQNLTSGDPFKILGGQLGGGLEQLLGINASPTGLPEMAKPEGLAGLLKGSGNPLEGLLAKYIQTQGINKGFDLSEAPGAAPFNPRKFGDVLELLSGEKLPGQVGGNVGTQNPVYLSGWKNPSQLNSMVPNATQLSMNQLSQIFPEMALLADKSKQDGLKGLLNQENTLATKLKAAESF